MPVAVRWDEGPEEDSRREKEGFEELASSLGRCSKTSGTGSTLSTFVRLILRVSGFDI
jgi:hypothetical protein